MLNFSEIDFSDAQYVESVLNKILGKCTVSCEEYSYDCKRDFKKWVDENIVENQGNRIYGAYIVKCRSNGEVLYIGKGGTVEGGNDFKLEEQDVVRRLKNVRGKGKKADEWINELCQECCNDGLYILVVKINSPSETKIAPAFIEGLLLQAFLKVNGRLPKYNKGF